MKTIGAGAVLLSSALYALIYYRQERSRGELLVDCAVLFERMAAELGGSMDRLENVFIRVAENSRGRTGMLLNKLTESMADLGECQFQELWSRCWRETMPELSDRLEDIYRLGEALGGFDAYEQREKILRCAQMLRKDGEELRSGLMQRAKLRGAVSLSIGAMTVILLI